MAATGRQLSEILVRYRALVHAQRVHEALKREVAVLFTGLDDDQKDAYIAAVERIDAEDG